MKKPRTDIKKTIKKRIEERHKRLLYVKEPEKKNNIVLKKNINAATKSKPTTETKMNERDRLRIFGDSSPYKYISSADLIRNMDLQDEKMKFIILGGDLDKSPFVPVMKMAMELYGNDEKYNNSILVFAYNRGEPFNEFKKLCPNKKIIIYQFEQIYNNFSEWYNPNSNILHIKKRTEHLNGWFKNVDEIWDYDVNNLVFLKKMGFNNVKHVPLKYANSLKRINNDYDKDIDVLFYGQVKGCDRRREIIRKIQEKHNIVIVPYGTTGDKLYNYVDRSKIVLNIHFYEGVIQEQVRIFELIINDKCVLSEYSKTNYFGDLIVECGKDEMSDKIDWLLENDNWKLFNNVGDLFKNNIFSKRMELKNRRARKVLVVIPNYSDKQLIYLDRVIDGFKKINKQKYVIDIVVHSNIPIDRNDITIKLHNEPPDNGWNWLPWECRKTIYINKDRYDLFLYTENDHLYTENNLDAFIKATNILSDDLIAGFIQYEEFPQYECGKFYPAYHATYEWDFNSVEQIYDYVIACFKNQHHAGFLLTKNQLNKVLETMGDGFLIDEKRGIKMPGLPGYDSPKVRCCTDVYTHGGMKKVIPISHFNDFLIHHLPNKYYGIFQNYSFDKTRMQPALQKLYSNLNMDK